jgi:putative DNA primase/helicase
MLKHALLYANFGWSVFPVSPNSKIPHKGTQGCLESTKDESIIEELWKKYPNSNVAVATGIKSCVFVLDIDVKNNVNGNITLEELESKYSKLPQTVEQFTPSGGRQLFFQYPENCKVSNSSGQLGSGLDIRGDGGYVLVPPSMIYSNGYTWEATCNPFEYQISIAPKWLLDLISENKRDFKIDLSDKDKVLKSGRRNERLFDIACVARNMGINDESTLSEYLKVINKKICEPNLEEKEVISIVQSCLKNNSEKSINSDEKIVWDLTEEGKKKATYKNALNFFKTDETLYGLFAHNEFSKRIELLKKPIWETSFNGMKNHSDNDVMQIKQYLTTKDFQCPTLTIREAIQTIAFNNRYNPVKEYLNSLKWDGVKRVENFFHEYMGSEDTEYSKFLGKLFFSAAVKRVYHPGCEYHYMIILEGKQGVGKSFALKAIGGDWFGEVPLMDRNTDTIDKMQGLWIIEVPELEVFKKKEVESLKNFLTNSIDRARLAYGHTTEEFPRQSIFVGTINPSELGYLRDTTGNRRFLPISVGDNIDIQAIKLTRDQFFAEAIKLVKDGFEIYVPREMDDEMAKQQSNRLCVDAWESIIVEYLNDFVPANKELTSMNIWMDVLKGDPSRLGRSDQMRIVNVLKKFGYQSKVVWKDGKLHRVYQKKFDENITENWNE